MSDTREWRFYVEDMLGFAEKVLVYTEGLDFESFASSELVYDATLRNIELIGESATRIPVMFVCYMAMCRGGWLSLCGIGSFTGI